MGGRRERGSKRYIALLRGINVGGKNPLPMRALVDMFQAVGCSRVESYIQSGNIIFNAGPILARRGPGMIELQIQKQFGFKVPILVRAADEFRALASANPFLARDPKSLHLMFLADAPTLAQIATLDPKRFAPDAFAVCGANVFLYLPDGSARTRLRTSYFDRALATTSTVRNWNTVQKLVALSEEVA